MMASLTSVAMTGMSGMAGMTTTATGSAAMASSTGMSHGGGGMSMGGGCKISVRAIFSYNLMGYADSIDRCCGTGTLSTLVRTLTLLRQEHIRLLSTITGSLHRLISCGLG